jgi:DNA (cytosine-5)-methyltransferase 1
MSKSYVWSPKHPQIIKILDLYCCAGGASMGYHRAAVKAGYEPHVIGVDNVFKKDYPFIFMKADVLQLIEDMPLKWWRQFDLIHASPPCQHYSITKNLARAQGKKVSTVDHIPLIRKHLLKVGVPCIIENVEGSGLVGATLCGSSFGLKVRRHRIFESNFEIESSTCDHKSQGRPVGVYGSLNDEIPKGGKTAETIEQAQEAMGMDWAGWSNLKEAIPPAYTEYVFNYYKRFRLKIKYPGVI